mgnify:CR=1 FL=1
MMFLVEILFIPKICNYFKLVNSNNNSNTTMILKYLLILVEWSEGIFPLIVRFFSSSSEAGTMRSSHTEPKVSRRKVFV